MASIVYKNIDKYYPGGVTAVRDFNLEIKDNEYVVFLGPSGCGKTTTLRLTAGLEDISEGDLYIDGKRVNDTEPKDRGVSFMFQNYALFGNMNVFDNIAFGLKPHRLTSGEVKEKVLKIAETLDLVNYLQRFPKQLSWGQRQRVALGRVYINPRKVVLFDEPLSSLDAKLRAAMRTELTALRDRFNITGIHVTHDQNDAMATADRIVIMKEGRIMQVGSPAELYNFPDNLFVAAFLGAPPMNIWETSVVKKDGGIFITLGATLIRLTQAQSVHLAAYSGKKLHAGIRPWDLRADGMTEAVPCQSAASARVTAAEFMGQTIHVHAESEGIKFIAAAPPDAVFKRGERIKAVINTEKLYFFDTETGNAVS